MQFPASPTPLADLPNGSTDGCHWQLVRQCLGQNREIALAVLDTACQGPVTPETLTICRPKGYHAAMLRAIIFDFDGVICDTEPLHRRAFAEVLRPLGIRLSEDEYYGRYAGLDDRAVLRAVLDDAGRRLGADETHRLLTAKDAAYFATIADGIERCPGVDAFVVEAARRWPLAVCSGARRIEIETLLTQAGLMRHFAVIVSADEVASSKPDPAGYRQTLLELRRTVPDLLPAQCLAIEDSGHGIAAARAAGMRVLAVESRIPSTQIADADLTAPDLRSLTPDRLATMVADTNGSTS